MSKSMGNITENVNNDYFEYVRNRFETELPDYEDAVSQNRSIIWGSEQSVQRDQAKYYIEDEESFEDTSDQSTLKFSDSDGETEV